MTLPGFWMDVGQPKDFLTGTQLYLAYQEETNAAALSTGSDFCGPVLVVSAQLKMEQSLMCCRILQLR
jgi:mannose-1-phosphate guanylyltransferase